MKDLKKYIDKHGTMESVNERRQYKSGSQEMNFIVQQLVKYGNTKSDAIKMTRKHYNHVIKRYRNSHFIPPVKKAEIISSLSANESVNEGQKKFASKIVDKFDQAYLKFSREVRDVIKMMDRSTGDKTDGKIIDKAYSKGLIPLDKLMKSWNRGQQSNPKIDEYSGMSKWQRDRLDQRSKEKGKKPKKVSKALQKKQDAWSKKYTVKSGGINIAKWKKDGSPAFPKESVNEDVQDLKKVVKELENASKMHLAQSKEFKHI